MDKISIIIFVDFDIHQIPPENPLAAELEKLSKLLALSTRFALTWGNLVSNKIKISG